MRLYILSWRKTFNGLRRALVHIRFPQTAEHCEIQGATYFGHDTEDTARDGRRAPAVSDDELLWRRRSPRGESIGVVIDVHCAQVLFLSEEYAFAIKALVG